MAFIKAAKPFLVDEIQFDRAGIEKYLMDDRLDHLLPRVAQDFMNMEEFSAHAIEQVIRKRAEREGVKAALLIHALRMLVMGEPVSPGIFDVLELAGRERTIKRMKDLSKIRDLKDKKGEES